jgi:hypothetical protein
MNYMILFFYFFWVDNMWVAINNKFNKVVTNKRFLFFIVFLITNGDIMSMELGCNGFKDLIFFNTNVCFL